MSKGNFAGAGLGDAGLIELIESGALSGCTLLDLWDNKLSDEGAIALARCEGLSELRTLNLGWNRIGPKGAKALASALFKLEQLGLYHNDVLDEGACALARSTHLGLESLNLCRNGLSPRSAEAIRKSPGMQKLRKFHAGCNQLGDEGLAALAQLPNIEELNVRMNGVGPSGAKALAKERPSLRLLGIEDNPLGDEGLLALAQDGLLGSTQVVILIETAITPTGVKAALGYGRTVKGRLRLGINGLGDEGVEAILAKLRLGDLVELSLAFNDIGSRGASLLASSECLSSLEVLDLVGNNIGEAGRSRLETSPFLSPQVLRIEPYRAPNGDA